MSDKQPEEAGNSSSSSEDEQTGLQRGSQESVMGRRSKKPQPEGRLEETSSEAASMVSQPSTSQTGMAGKVSLLHYVPQSFERITKPRNMNEQEAASEIISQLDLDSFDGNERASVSKIIIYKGLQVRVDIQRTFRHRDKLYATVKVQINGRIVAGVKVLCDYSFGRQKINGTLLESLAQSEMAILDIDLEAASMTLTPNKWPTEMGGLSDVHVMVARIYHPANRRERNAVMEIIHQFDWDDFDGNEPPGTIERLSHNGVDVRVDIQGTYPNEDGGRSVNVQVQIGNRSVAGILVPGNYSWGRNRIKEALLKSLTEGQIVTVGQDDIP